MTERPTAVSKALMGLMRAFDYRRLSKRAQAVVSVLAALLFAGGAVLAWIHLDTTFAELSWPPLVALLVTAPAPLFLSALELRATANGLGDEIDRQDAMQIAVLGYAANFLPIPGGTILRISTLSGRPETSTGRSTHATMTVGGFWLALAGLAAGIGILVLGEAWIGLVITGASMAVFTISFLSARRLRPQPGLGHFVRTFMIIETAFILLAAVRTYLAFLVLGVPVPVLAALVVASSSALSTAVGLAPSGLGLREGLAAMLAAASGVSAGAGFLASTLLRVSGVAAAGAISLITLIVSKRRGPREAAAPEDL